SGVGTERGVGGMAKEPDGSLPTEAELPTVDDTQRILERAYRRFDELLPALTPVWLATPITYSKRGRTATLPPWAVLRHIVNHTTYHRGQVASKLKRFGIVQPDTDLVFWAFEQIPQKT